MLVICRNCGMIQRYDEDVFIKHNTKNYASCNCGNRHQWYKNRRKAINEQIKLGNEEAKALIDENKYNHLVFGIHKGFDFKKIDSNEPIDKYLKAGYNNDLKGVR